MPERRWLILAVLFLARTAMGFQFQSVASTAPALMADLQIGFAALGSLIGLYMLPGILIAMPGGLLTNRFGNKTVCAAGLLMMLAGGMVMGAGPLALVFIGRVLSGTGAVLFNLVLTKMTTDWFAGREIILAMGVVLASWPFGIAAGLLLQPLLPWQLVMLLAAGLCGAALLLIALCYADPISTKPAAASALPPWQKLLPTFIAGLMWGNLNAALVLFFSFGPAVMVAHQVAPVAAAARGGAALWVVMLSVPLGGAVLQRTGRAGAAIVISAITGALALAAVPSGMAPLALAILFGITVGPSAAAINALPALVLSPQHRAGGLGVYMTCYYAIQTAAPAVAGALRDHWATPAAALLFAATLMGAIAILQGFFRLSRCVLAT